ncbi:hypothetical protein B0T22DRAFT_459172 [Podospora appendiculata]|uniref:3-hydroxyacyl-CoA dehydrogenase n=1 Tax=Podospora appendiculata TaxID=314037 RepID=A0AAE0X927_9PEZI|nr:hypothetical protein B0T22DRAFT_459172 [Podospora appendiculata]
MTSLSVHISTTNTLLHSVMANSSPAVASKLVRVARNLSTSSGAELSKNRALLCAPRARTRPLCQGTLIPRSRYPFASYCHLSTDSAPPFFATSASNETSTQRWRPPTEEDLNERPVLIIGAGNLGRRIALVWASASRPVTLYDVSHDALKAATEYITDNLAEYCTRRGTHPGHVCTTTDLRVALTTGRLEGTKVENEAHECELHSGAKGPWMAIECLPESLELKVDVLSHIEHLLPRNCILASNSSNLQTSEMAPSLHHPERLLNTHYFIPPRNRMVELMSSSHTYEEIFPFLAVQMKRVGFTPMIVPAGIQSQGFIFNRIWAACKRETLAVLAEGVAKPGDIDALFRDFFHAEKGPCERMDDVGLDTIAKVEQHYIEQRPDLREMGAQKPLDWLKREYVVKGNLGEKTGDGLFTAEERAALDMRHKEEHYQAVEETTGA